MGINDIRGKIDEIVLSLLAKSDMHAGEIKDEIDKEYSEIKQCTLYSSLNRLLELGLIQEYRASSSDGLRRKFYRLKSKGTRGNLKFKPITDYKPKSTPYRKPASEFKSDKNESEPKSTSQAQAVNTNGQYKVQSVDTNVPIEDYYLKVCKKQRNFGVDEDSFAFSSYNYKESLEKLYPKLDAESVFNRPSGEDENVAEIDDNINDFNEDVKNPNSFASEDEKVKNIASDIDEDEGADSGLHDYAKDNGIKIKTSKDTNRYRGNKILINKLRLASSFTTYALIIIELLISFLFLDKFANYGLKVYGITAAICFALPLFALLLYLSGKNRTVKELAKFQNVMTVSVAAAFIIMITVLAFAFINDVDFYNVNELLKSVILPAVFTLNIPIYVAIKYSFAKSDSYLE